MVFPILLIISILMLIIFLFSLTLTSPNDSKSFAVSGWGIFFSFIFSVIFFTLMIAYKDNGDESKSYSSGGTNYQKSDDLYDYKSWDYDHDGNMNDKEATDYIEFRNQMDNVAHREMQK